MIIKSHIRGGYRSAAEYMKEQGQNEKTRLVELSDPSAKNLDDAFHNMWVVASNTKATKPLHHISINPMKDERLTDEQVLKIVQRCEEKYGYKMLHHQRVIVEHVKDGRQHFHVIWNRVSLYTGRAVWPGEHWKKSKQICREMEKELGLKCPTPKRYGSKNRTYKGKSVRGKGNASRVRQMRKSGTTKITTKARYRKTATGRRRLHTPLVFTPYSNPIKGRMNGLPSIVGGNDFIASLIKLIGVKSSAQQAASQASQPLRPNIRKGWPDAAVIDWELWGHKNPHSFFSKWPELSV